MEVLAIVGGIAAITVLLQQTNEVVQLLIAHRSDSVELRNALTNLSYHLPLLEEILVLLNSAGENEQQNHSVLIKEPIKECYRCIEELKTILDKVKSRIRDGQIVFPRWPADYKKKKITEIVTLTNTIEKHVQTLVIYRGMVYMSRTDLYTVIIPSTFSCSLSLTFD